MTTAYSYDIRNRMTKIEYKDGEAVLDGFTYTLSAGSNIVTTAHADGAEWTYEYDGRHRLTKAERDNDGDTITATYEYTYDDGDSLITKVEPFSDDFNDTNYTGWTVGAGTWSASSGAMRNTVTSESWSYFSRSQSDADHDLQFTYVCNDDSDSGYTLRVEARFTGWSDDRLCLYIEPTRMILKEMVNGGSWTWLSTNTSADTDEGTEYNVRMECDDDDITVWRGEVGGGMSQVLSTSSATVTSTNSIYFDVSPDADYSIDNIRLIADDLTTTTTFAYDDANELTSMTNNGTVNFTYDDWGRMISKYQGDFDASYAYRYGDKLYSITSDFNGEGTVTYQYGADGKRRQRTANSVTTKYRWDAGWNMINEENVLDVLTMTYVANGGVLAELTGTVPSSGTARYYCHDHLGSTRRLRDADKSSAGQYEFTPYGSPYADSGIALSALGGAFTGKPWDATAHAYYFPYRYYPPSTARWLMRDPLGMQDGPNSFCYAVDNPINAVDPLGLATWLCQKPYPAFGGWGKLFAWAPHAWIETSGGKGCEQSRASKWSFKAKVQQPRAWTKRTMHEARCRKQFIRKSGVMWIGEQRIPCSQATERLTDCCVAKRCAFYIKKYGQGGFPWRKRNCRQFAQSIARGCCLDGLFSPALSEGWFFTRFHGDSE